MDTRDRLILSLAHLLREMRVRLGLVRSLGDARRVASDVVQKLEERSFAFGERPVDNSGHRTPGGDAGFPAGASGEAGDQSDGASRS